jgi:hypothetical protein
LIERDLFGKPASTFPDHARAARLTMKYVTLPLLLALSFAAGGIARAQGSGQPSNSGYSIEGRGGGVPTSRNPPATRPVPPATQAYPPGLRFQNRNLPPPPAQR